MADDGILANPVGVELHHFFGRFLRLVGLEEDVLAVLVHFAGGGIEGDRRCRDPASNPPWSMASSSTSTASSLDFRLGAKPPSSPTEVL